MDIADRLAHYVDRSGGDDGCWPFTGAKHVFGYGILWDNDLGRADSAHRIAWRIAHGDIPEGLEVCHHCDNPPCCNPAHLFLGTQKDNIDDMIQKRRGNRDTRARGESQGASRLTASEVLEIRQLAAEGYSQRGLAREFRVGRTTIAHIVRRETWKHLPSAQSP